MARIKAFRFIWTDAWFRIDEGYDSILEISDSGKVSIQFLINKEQFQLDLTDKEDEFIEKMTLLKKWNQREYHNYDILDGTAWRLYFTYDDTVIVSSGMNGFPSNFLDFLAILHQFNVPKSRFEADEKWIKREIKHTKIADNPNMDSIAMYYI